MKTTIIAALTALMLMSGPAAAIDAKGNWTAQGARSCGTWLEHKRLEDGNSWLRITSKHWLAGFLAGANRYRRGKRNYLEGTDMDSALLWIDKYCAENPLKHSGDAAHRLIEELAKR